MVTSRSGDWMRNVANPPAKRYMSRERNRGERGRAVSVLQSKRRGGARLRANAATPRWAPRKPLRGPRPQGPDWGPCTELIARAAKADPGAPIGPLPELAWRNYISELAGRISVMPMHSERRRRGDYGPGLWGCCFGPGLLWGSGPWRRPSRREEKEELEDHIAELKEALQDAEERLKDLEK